MISRSAEKNPPPGPPIDQARWIFAHPRDGSFGDGQRVVDILLTGRDVLELSLQELELLARGYNWWGNHAMSFQTARLALARDPLNSERVRSVGLYARNAFCGDLPEFVEACDKCLAEGLGPAAFWHLLKAEQCISYATGEYELEDFEWFPGEPILHPERLRMAAQALESAITCEPGLRNQATARDWLGLLPGTECDWNTKFAAVLQEPMFRHLTV